MTSAEPSVLPRRPGVAVRVLVVAWVGVQLWAGLHYHLGAPWSSRIWPFWATHYMFLSPTPVVMRFSADVHRSDRTWASVDLDRIFPYRVNANKGRLDELTASNDDLRRLAAYVLRHHNQDAEAKDRGTLIRLFRCDWSIQPGRPADLSSPPLNRRLLVVYQEPSSR